MVEEKTVREAAKQQEMLSTAKADMQAVFKAREEKKAKRVAVNRYAPRARRAPPGSRRSRGSERGGPSCAGWAGPSGRSRQAALAASAWQHSELYCAPVVLRLHLVAVYPRDRADAQAWDAAPAAASAAGARHSHSLPPPPRSTAARWCARSPTFHPRAPRLPARSEEQTQMQLQRNASTAEDGPAVWNQVGLISDLKEKANPSTDTSRMRSLLVQLKHS